MLEVAPGLHEGMKFKERSETELKETKESEDQNKVMTLADILTLNDDLGDLDLQDEAEEQDEGKPNDSGHVSSSLARP